MKWHVFILWIPIAQALTLFHVDDQWISSPNGFVSNAPELWLRQAVRATITSWKACFTAMGVDRITTTKTHLACDE